MSKSLKNLVFFAMLVFILIFTVSCITVEQNNNSNSTQEVTVQTKSPETVTVSGSVQFPNNVVVANIRKKAILGYVNFTILRVYINGIFYGFPTESGFFAFASVPVATEYVVEIKNHDDILLLKIINTQVAHLINSLSTARALLLDRIRLTKPNYPLNLARIFHEIK
ncbi:hypothetical protein ACFL35_12085 [Candidatus Riflebacteria bacterium]